MLRRYKTAVITALAAVTLMVLIFCHKQSMVMNFDNADGSSSANGKVFVITGANSGIGYQTALELAQGNATVVLAVRSLSRGNTAKNEILSGVPDARVEVLYLDLACFTSIRSFAVKVKRKYQEGIDVLVNNAGIMAPWNREVTEDGLEMNMGVNHFGHFLLTALLLPAIKLNGRVINHASAAAIFATRNFTYNDMLSENRYVPMQAYANSKLANLMFTYELNRRLLENGNKKNIISIAVHPGYSDTPLFKPDNSWGLQGVNKFIAMTPREGSLSQTLAAVGEGIPPSTGTWIGPLLGIIGFPAVQSTWFIPYANHPPSHLHLWTESERLTGQSFL